MLFAKTPKNSLRVHICHVTWLHCKTRKYISLASTMDNLYCTWDLSTTSRFSFLKQSLGSSRRLWISMFWELCGSVCTCLHMGHTLNHQAYLWWTLRILSKLWRYGPEVENSVQMADLPKVTAAPQRKMQPRLCQGKEFCSHMCYIELTFKDFSYFYK